MELIRGVPITEYCDQQSLTARRRLDLFVEVCRAVHHAHQKGVIHRDLKPRGRGPGLRTAGFAPRLDAVPASPDPEGPRLAGQPLAEASVRSTVGRAYVSLGEYEGAELHLGRALELLDASGYAAPDALYPVLWNLTDVMFKLERDVGDAFAMADRARRVGHDWIAAADAELASSLDAMTAAVRAQDIETADRAFDAAAGR